MCAAREAWPSWTPPPSARSISRAGCRGIPRPRLHQRVLDAGRGLVPLRADVQAGRDGLRRTASPSRLSDDHFHATTGQQCRRRARPPRGVAPDRSGGAPRPLHVGDRGLGRCAPSSAPDRAMSFALAPDLDLSVEGFPFMTGAMRWWRASRPRVFRISFSGELAYEISTWPPGTASRCGQSPAPASRTASRPTARDDARPSRPRG